MTYKSRKKKTTFVKKRKFFFFKSIPFDLNGFEIFLRTREQYMKQIQRLILLCSIIFSIYACDSEADPKQVDATNFDNVDMMQSSADMMSGGSQSGDTEYLTYTRTVSAGPDSSVDLIAYRFDTNEEIILNQDVPKEEMDCSSRGCLIHPSLKYVAWAQIPSGSVSFSLFLAPIDQASRKVDLAQKKELARNVILYQFTDTRIIYSSVKDANIRDGVAIQYEPLDGSAPATEVALISANGGFRTTKFDDLLIIVNTPDLSSMTVSFRNLSNGLAQDLYTFGEAGGTGSEFAAGTSPIGFSPDGTYLVVLTNNDFLWRINLLEASEAAPPPVVKELFPVRNVPEACSKPAPYQFTQVLNQPVFNQSADQFYLLMKGDCTKRSNATINRDDHEIFRFSKNDLTGEPTNISRFPRVNNWGNQDVNEFALSKDDSKIAFVASRPTKANSHAIWLVDNPAEPTENLNYNCSRGASQTDLLGVTRCEFLTYDKSGTDAKYRALQFHKASAF